MTTRPDGLDEDALLAYLRGEASPGDATRITSATEEDPAFRAELALMGQLKGALAAASDGADTREFGWRRLEAEIAKDATVQPGPTRRSYLWRVAALVLGGVALGQGAYIALAPGAAQAPTFRTVTEAPSAVFGLAVGFAPSAQMGAVQVLLTELDARIIDGPGAIGLYRLAFPTEAARDAARAALRASPLVDLVAEG